MARAHLRHTIEDTAGNVVQNALVRVYLEGTTTPVTDMYAASSGGSPITTLTSNNQGEIEAWFTSPKTVDVLVTDNSDTAYYPTRPSITKSWTSFTETIDVPPAPADVVLQTEHLTTLGLSSITGDGALVIDVATHWGIKDGAVYFDSVAPDAGEEALMSYDQTTGALSWLPLNEVH